jgi:hypothetical protein
LFSATDVVWTGRVAAAAVGSKTERKAQLPTLCRAVYHALCSFRPVYRSSISFFTLLQKQSRVQQLTQISLLLQRLIETLRLRITLCYAHE